MDQLIEANIFDIKLEFHFTNKFFEIFHFQLKKTKDIIDLDFPKNL